MWSRFIEDRAGGAAPIFALGIIPIIGLVGAAVDYSRGNAARTAMLASLDATALMLSRDAANMDPGAGHRQGDVASSTRSSTGPRSPTFRSPPICRARSKAASCST